MKYVPFTDLCDRYRIEHRTTGNHTRRGWVQIKCPYCGDGNDSFHMGYCLSFPRFNCWKCGKHGLLQTLRIITGETDAVLHTVMNCLPRERDTAVKKATGVLQLPHGIGPLRKAHRDYLRQRRFNPDRIETIWGVKGLGIGAYAKTKERRINLSWRLYLPIEVGGVISSWTTRSIADNPSIRYLSATPEHERVCHKELLYGEDYAGDTIIIVEGPTKVWRIGPGTVATFGTRPTPAQIVRMGRYSKRYVLFDHGAERYAQLLVQQLSVYEGHTYNVEIDADDPDDMTKTELRQVRRLLQ
jgi:hypothetical protein